MVNSSNDNPLNEKDKKKFVKEMMKLATKTKKSSKEEISIHVDKKIRRFESIQELIYIITVILAFILTYIILMSNY